MHNYDARIGGPAHKRLKRWQRNFIALHGLRIAWHESNDLELLVYEPAIKHEHGSFSYAKRWCLARKSSVEHWVARYKFDEQKVQLSIPKLWSDKMLDTLTRPLVLSGLVKAL